MGNSKAGAIIYQHKLIQDEIDEEIDKRMEEELFIARLWFSKSRRVAESLKTLNRGKPGKRNDASVDSTRSGVMVEGVSRVGLAEVPQPYG